ncbi:MAG: AgmX/PglI C-terminal domain-containing protein, partial [Nannocystaceae bacterium]
RGLDATVADADASDDEDVWGGLTGTEVGEAFGVSGLGLVGTGRGGGGVGEGTIGLGNTGLIGTGSGSGTGSGYGRGAAAGFGGRGARVPQVRQAPAQVSGALDKDIVRRIVRAHSNEVRFCYEQGLQRDPSLRGRVAITWTISGTGQVLGATTKDSTLADASVAACIAKAVDRWTFPKPRGGGVVKVTMPFVLDADQSRQPSSLGRSGWGSPWARRPRPRSVAKAAHTGRFAEVQRLLAAGQAQEAYELAWSWSKGEPSDVLALLALGETLERRDRPGLAARVYGSLIDLHPSRPDVRRTAGQRLERLEHDGALALAIDTYDKAAAARPDHPSGARLHAWALVRRGEHAEAFEVLREAAWRPYPPGRFAGVRTLLRQDLALVAAAWLAQTQGDAKVQALARIDEARVVPATEGSARFVVTWETDTTDVDVLPRVGGQGRLLGHRIADVRTGYGPEARVLRGDRIPARLHAAVRYFDRGAMGHAMGTLQVIVHDGAGGLTVQSRPFVLMQQRGVLDMGSFETAPRSVSGTAS